MIDIKKAPQLFGESADWRSTNQGIDALKNSNVSFNGYGIAEGEIIVFPTEAEIKANPKAYVKQRPTSPGSSRVTSLILVERINGGEGRTSWFNMSTLSRQANQADGTRFYLNDFMESMGNCNDDFERFHKLIGKKVVGARTTPAYGPEFDKDTRKPTGEYVSRDYVEVELVEDAPAATEEPKKGKK